MQAERSLAEPGAEAQVTVLLVDDQERFRGALRELIACADGFALVGEASSGEEATRAVQTLAPQLVLMDVVMPGMGGIAAARTIIDRRPAPMVVLISVDDLAVHPRGQRARRVGSVRAKAGPEAVAATRAVGGPPQLMHPPPGPRAASPTLGDARWPSAGSVSRDGATSRAAASCTGCQRRGVSPDGSGAATRDPGERLPRHVAEPPGKDRWSGWPRWSRSTRRRRRCVGPSSWPVARAPTSGRSSPCWRPWPRRSACRGP